MFRWQLVSAAYLTLLQLVVILFLGRFLAYREMGVYAVFQIVFRLSIALFEPGMFVSLIQKKDCSLNTIGALSKIQVRIAVLVGSLIVLFYLVDVHYLRSNALVAGMSLLLFASIAVGSQYTSLLTRQFMQKQMAIAQIAGATLEFILILSLIHFFEPLLVFSSAMLVRFVLYYFLAYHYCKPVLLQKLLSSATCTTETREHVRFSAFQVMNQGLSFVQGNFDSVLIIGVFGLSVLGPYNFASEISYLLFSKINPIFNKAVFPVLAKHQHESAEREWILGESLLSHALVCIGLYILLYFHLSDVIPMALNDPEGKILLFAKYICVMAIIRSVNNVIFSNLLALGESKNLLRWNIAVLLFNYFFIAIIYFGHFSIEHFLFINIWVSFSVLLFSLYRLFRYYTNKQLLVTSLMRYALYFITCALTLVLIKKFALGLMSSIVLSIFAMLLLSFLFYREKVKKLIHLKII